MCINNTKHFYIYEPLEMYSKEIVIPIFIYTISSDLHAKCLIPHQNHKTPSSTNLYIPENLSFDDPNLKVISVKNFEKTYLEIERNGQKLSSLCGNRLYKTNKRDRRIKKITLPSPWRIKADGKIIRHIPISLYAHC
jgi:hypothetical protein